MEPGVVVPPDPRPPEGPTRRILTVNVNATPSVTESIAEALRAVAEPGVEIVGLTPTFGAPSCEGNVQSYLAAVGVMDAVLTCDQPFNPVIQARFGEHRREGLQELLDQPVVDIPRRPLTSPPSWGAATPGVSTLGRTVPLIEDRLRLAGLMERCASVRASSTSVPDLERDENAAVETIVAEAQRAVEQDRAEVAVLGCGGMAALEGAVHQRCGVPVVDGVAAAVSVAQSLVRLRLRTSKVRAYTSPLPKDLKGFRFGR